MGHWYLFKLAICYFNNYGCIYIYIYMYIRCLCLPCYTDEIPGTFCDGLTNTLSLVGLRSILETPREPWCLPLWLTDCDMWIVQCTVWSFPYSEGHLVNKSIQLKRTLEVHITVWWGRENTKQQKIMVHIIE